MLPLIDPVVVLCKSSTQCLFRFLLYLCVQLVRFKCQGFYWLTYILRVDNFFPTNIFGHSFSDLPNCFSFYRDSQ